MAKRMPGRSRVLAHNKQTPAAGLRQRIAEEAQLLAEEKWIIEALKKIKVQLNSLQIERLHLESMRSKVHDRLHAEQTIPKSSSVQQKATTDVEMSQQMHNKCTATDAPTNAEQPSTSIDLSKQTLGNYDFCNTEELNLSITNSVFNPEQYNRPSDEEDEDDEDMENYLLDMDLLMSGN